MVHTETSVQKQLLINVQSELEPLNMTPETNQISETSFYILKTTDIAKIKFSFTVTNCITVRGLQTWIFLDLVSTNLSDALTYFPHCRYRNDGEEVIFNFDMAISIKIFTDHFLLFPHCILQYVSSSEKAA